MRYTRLSASFFQANRARLAELLPEGALAIVSSNDIMPTNADGTLGFVQNSDLYYLSGVDQEETTWFCFPSARDPKMREMLFLRETSELISIWEGARLTKPEAREVSNIESVYWTSAFAKNCAKRCSRPNRFFWARTNICAVQAKSKRANDASSNTSNASFHFTT